MEISRFFKELCRKADFLAAMILLGICLFTVFNILLRTLFKSPIFGAYEYVCYLSVIVISLSLANCALKNGHTAIDLLLDRFSFKNKKIIKIVTNFCTIILFVFIIEGIVKYAYNKYLLGELSFVLKIPLYYIVTIIIIGFILLTFVALFKLIEQLLKPY